MPPLPMLPSGHHGPALFCADCQPVLRRSAGRLCKMSTPNSTYVIERVQKTKAKCMACSKPFEEVREEAIAGRRGGRQRQLISLPAGGCRVSCGWASRPR